MPLYYKHIRGWILSNMPTWPIYLSSSIARQLTGQGARDTFPQKHLAASLYSAASSPRPRLHPAGIHAPLPVVQPFPCRMYSPVDRGWAVERLLKVDAEQLQAATQTQTSTVGRTTDAPELTS